MAKGLMKIVNRRGDVMNCEFIGNGLLDDTPIAARQACADARHVHGCIEHDGGVRANTRESLPDRFVTIVRIKNHSP